MYIICIKDLISINGAKFHYIISTVKFHTQFEKKTIVSIPSAYVYILNIYFSRIKNLITKKLKR